MVSTGLGACTFLFVFVFISILSLAQPGLSELAVERNALVNYDELGAEDLEVQELWDRMGTLLRAAGGEISDKIAPRVFRGRGRGIVALEDLPEGYEFYSSSNWINIWEETIVDLHPKWRRYVDDRRAIIAEGLLIARVSKGLDTFENDYDGIFPEVVYENFKSWGTCYAGVKANVTVLNMLPPDAREETLELQRGIHGQWRFLVESVQRSKELPWGVTKEEFFEAVCHRYSRAFSYFQDYVTMLPLLDLMNHDTHYSATFQNRHETAEDGTLNAIYSATTIREIQKGEEILFSYGTRDGGHYFGTYGFAHPQFGGYGNNLEIRFAFPDCMLYESHPNFEIAMEMFESLERPSDFGIITFYNDDGELKFGFMANALYAVYGGLLYQNEFFMDEHLPDYNSTGLNLPLNAKEPATWTFEETIENLSDKRFTILLAYIADQCHRTLSMIPKPVPKARGGGVQELLWNQALVIANAHRKVLAECVNIFSPAYFKVTGTCDN